MATSSTVPDSDRMSNQLADERFDMILTHNRLENIRIFQMTYDTVIVNSHVILPNGMIDKNILIDNGKIVGLTNDVPASDKKIDGSGLVSVPGPIDTHVHYGVYSPINKAAKTESHAAAIGGVTTMMRMLRLGDPFTSSLQSQLDAASKNHYVDYAIHASIFTQRANQRDELLRGQRNHVF